STTMATQKNVLIRSRLKQAGQLIHDNRLAEAKAILERVVQAHRNDPLSWEMLADVNSRLGLANDAIECYRRLVVLSPNDVSIQVNLGASLELQERFSEALECYQSVLQLQPASPEVRYNVGNAYKGLGRFEEAVSQYREALRLMPGLFHA